MESRRALVLDVLSGRSLSEACRIAGVTRPTGRKWVARAASVGIDNIQELSRAPTSVYGKTTPAVEAALLDLKQRYPEWAGRKLVVLLEREQALHLASRTADHILSRHGMTKPRAPKVPVQRFERPACGNLLQMDFKGLPKDCKYSLLTVLDDHARYCFAFEAVPDKTMPTVQKTLWRIFAEHGLPETMLMDNGDCWGSSPVRSVNSFEAWLMLLGIKPLHGRPRHPQTQGKVERFHKTAKTELGDLLFQKDIQALEPITRAFVDRYNWVRPHDSLGGRVPGTSYAPFQRPRPDRVPKHEIPEGALSRKVDEKGFFSFKGTQYKIGMGLSSQRVELREDLFGLRVYFAGHGLSYLGNL